MIEVHSLKREWALFLITAFCLFWWINKRGLHLYVPITMLRVVVYFTIENGMSNAFINAIEKAQKLNRVEKNREISNMISSNLFLV